MTNQEYTQLQREISTANTEKDLMQLSYTLKQLPHSHDKDALVSILARKLLKVTRTNGES